MRSTHPCDGCSLRRVRCEGGPPCRECEKQSVQCTFLRVRKKRGPKCPRSTTNRKIQGYQEALQSANNQVTTPAARPSNLDPLADENASALFDHGIPLAAYCKFLAVFLRRLYGVWPIISADELILNLTHNSQDLESYALAASLCAAVIAQLRLPEHSRGISSVSSHRFARETQRLRNRLEVHESYSLTSLLTAFFLHVYYANAEKVRTAGFLLREALTHAHGLRLHRVESYESLDAIERQLRLRVYWILFVSERTYCVQNGLPPVLRPIELVPGPDAEAFLDRRSLAAFTSLTRLFTYLDGDFIGPSACSQELVVFDEKRQHVSSFQRDLSCEAAEGDLDETQQVDILVTRNWIRILLWQYTIMHCTVSVHADDEAFSTLLPFHTAREMLALFSTVSINAIRAHGYGLELKIFRIADSLLDVLLCAPFSTSIGGMLVGSRDAMHSLEHVLLTVGGPSSLFLRQLKNRMVESELAVASVRPLFPAAPITLPSTPDDSLDEEAVFPSTIEGSSMTTTNSFLE